MKEEEIKKLFILLGIIKPPPKKKKRKKVDAKMREKGEMILGALERGDYASLGLKRLSQMEKWLSNMEGEEIDDKKPIRDVRDVGKF